MGLFDFLDLEGNTGAWGIAGEAAKGYTEGREAGTKRTYEEEAMLNQAMESDQKIGMNAFNMEQKRRQAPLEDLVLQQKVNLATPAETKEDFDQAFEEIYPDGGPKSLSQGAKDLIIRRAKEIARARVPKLDINNPEEWNQYAQDNVRSDAQMDLDKLEAQVELTRLKEEAKAALQDKRFSEARAALRARQGFAKDENLKSRASREGISSQNRAESARKQKEKLGSLVLKEANQKLSAFGKISANTRALELVAGYHEQIKETGSPEAVKQFEAKYGEYIKGKSDSYMGGSGRDYSYRDGKKIEHKSKYKAKRFNPNGSYSNGDKIMMPNGKVMIYRNGKLYAK